ncbi:hypothetical protein LEN26_016790 [Aphanomyces euteiches]|nr:hypothetical protein LEN26_016790 [Aphanomyces euteiches]
MDTPIPTPAAIPAVVVVPAAPAVDVDKAEKVPTVQAILVDNLPRLEVDFLVKKAKAIGSDNWVWRQIVLHGQTLDVVRKGAIAETFSTVDCEFNEIGAKVYQIVSRGDTRLTFCCPSETLYNKFATVFRASTTTAFWTFPPVVVLDDLVGVAKTIVETEDGLKASPVKAPSVPASNVTVAQVQAHLATLKAAYDEFPLFGSKEELYQYVQSIEADFVDALAAKQSKNFPPLVQQILKLFPEVVGEDGSMSGLTLQLDCTKCPNCLKPFSLSTQMNLHVGGKTLVCDQCENWTHYETFKLAQMRKEVPTFEFKIGIPLFQTKRTLPIPEIPRDGKAKTYMDRLWRIVFEDECITHHRVPYKAKFALEERIMACLNRLDLVQLIYRQLLFMGQIVAHYDYWNHPTVIQAAIHRYDKFRVVANAPKAQDLAATLDILLVGQTHQLTSSTAVLPADKGSDSTTVRLGDTAFAWGEAFNEPYSSCALDLEGWIETKPGNEEVQHKFLRHQWKKFCRLPSRGNRFVGVQEILAVESLIGYNADFTAEGLATAVSVIGSLEVDERIARGKFRNLLTPDASRVYTYRYAREVRSLFEKILAPGWY